MNSDITVSELASMAADNENYLADKTVDNFSIEDDVFIMNI